MRAAHIRSLSALTASLLFCFFMAIPYAAEASSELDSKLELARGFIKQGEAEEAESVLDSALEMAKSETDYDALMEIGDMYMSIDKSLGKKALHAWTEAGRCKAKEGF